jgi:Na+/H+-dicarboxylate symporter
MYIELYIQKHRQAHVRGNGNADNTTRDKGGEGTVQDIFLRLGSWTTPPAIIFQLALAVSSMAPRKMAR